MVTRDKIIEYLDLILEPSKYKDIVPNGLQLEGKSEIKTIAGATSATQPVIEECLRVHADLLLVHHGWFWPSDPKPITGSWKKKLSMALDAGLNLAAYHIPLDCHWDLGNNVPVLRDLGAAEIFEINLPLYGAVLQKPVSAITIDQKLEEMFQQVKTVGGDKEGIVSKIAICSGAGQSYFREAIDWGADYFITGEGVEWVYGMAVENDCRYTAVGHNRGEQVGVKKLLEDLSKKFGLKHTFIPEENPF